MGFYSRWILPQVIELAMRQKNFILCVANY